MISLDMCRDPDLMQHIGHTIFQSAFHSHSSPFFCFFHLRAVKSADTFDPIQQYIVVERLHDIIICAAFESILCDIFLSDRGKYYKIRVLFDRSIIIDFFHNREPIHFRHNQI